MIIIIIIITIIIKKINNATLGESGLHPISPMTPATQYQHIEIREMENSRR